MHAKLAEIYGTADVAEADVEKLAAAEMAERLSETEQADLSGLTEEQLEELADEVLEGASADESDETEEEVEETEEETEQVETEEPADEATEKVAEADYLGRVMAHAYAQELRDIEKTATWHATAEGVRGVAQGSVRAAREAAYGSAAAVGKPDGKVHGWLRRKATKALEGGGKHLESVGRKATKLVARTKGGEGAMHGSTAKRIGAGVYGAGATAAGGAGYAAKKHHDGKGKRKAASADLSSLDQLAILRAREMLAESGIDPDTGNPFEKQASAAEVLGAEVEARAQAMLEANGWTRE